MKVGNIVSGLEVVDVKRINKLNLIQFLKEVDSYLQQGYRIDVNSARQVGLVLQTDMFKTEAACSPKVGSAGVKADEAKVEAAQAEATETKVEDSKETESTSVEPETLESSPVKKPTTTRSKKATQ